MSYGKSVWVYCDWAECTSQEPEPDELSCATVADTKKLARKAGWLVRGSFALCPHHRAERAEIKRKQKAGLPWIKGTR